MREGVYESAMTSGCRILGFSRHQRERLLLNAWKIRTRIDPKLFRMNIEFKIPLGRIFKERLIERDDILTDIGIRMFSQSRYLLDHKVLSLCELGDHRLSDAGEIRNLLRDRYRSFHEERQCLHRPVVTRSPQDGPDFCNSI